MKKEYMDPEFEIIKLAVNTRLLYESYESAIQSSVIDGDGDSTEPVGGRS